MDALDGLHMPLESERDTLVALTPSDAETAVGVATFGPRGGGLGETLEHVLADAPVTRVVLNTECGEGLLNGQFKRVGVRLLLRVADHIRHQLVITEEIEEEGHGTTKAEPTIHELTRLTQKYVHFTPRSHL